MRQFHSVAVAAAVVLASLSPAFALQKPPAAALTPKAGPIKACSLVARAEVKKLVPWAPHVDQMPEEEEPVGTAGSSCNYPSVTVQVLSASQGLLEAAKKQYKLETVSGVGEEAYFRNNKNLYAELYVRAGQYLLTLQGNVPTGKTPESMKPALESLAKLYLEKLR